MLTRREFLGKATVAAGALAASQNLLSAGRPAWSGPIGLELYTVRDKFAKDPAKTLMEVAAAGYKEVEIGPGSKPDTLAESLRAAGLTASSGYFDPPKTPDGWKKSVEEAHGYGLKYIVVGDNPSLSVDQWKKRAELYTQCGQIAKSAGVQFCYHAHFREMESESGPCGYDILLSECDPALLKMEMDLFWMNYAGADPLPYWKKYPGRFPLVHIKDLRKGVEINPKKDPPGTGPNPFAPVGQGTIEWAKYFARFSEAGVKHIFVEQDRCDLPELEAIKISYDYLRKLRLS